MKLLIGTGILGALIAIIVSLAAFFAYVTGVIWAFGQSILLGLVSLIPVVGFVEGILRLAHVI